MNFTIEHTFKNIALSDYESKVFMSEVFNEAIKGVAGLRSREVQERKEVNGKLFRKIRMQPERDLPAVLKKLVSGDLITTEESWFDPKTHSVEWTNKLSVLSDKVKLNGRVEMTEVPGGVKRKLTGTIDVSIFGVGKLVEKAVIDDLTATYEKIAAFTQRWIDDKKYLATA